MFTEPEGGYGSTMTIFDELRTDHDTQRTLADLVLETSGDSEGRTELTARLGRELRAHAASEEKHFYSSLMSHDPTIEKARHSVHEHEQLDELLETVETSPFDSPRWLTHARSLVEKLRHHLEEEEHEVFQQAGRVLSEKEKDQLGAAYRREMTERLSERTS